MNKVAQVALVFVIMDESMRVLDFFWVRSPVRTEKKHSRAPLAAPAELSLGGHAHYAPTDALVNS